MPARPRPRGFAGDRTPRVWLCRRDRAPRVFECAFRLGEAFRRGFDDARVCAEKKKETLPAPRRDSTGPGTRTSPFHF